MLPRRPFPLSFRFAAANRAAAARWGITAVTVVDTATGETFANDMARLPIRSASVIKVPILCAALYTHLAAGSEEMPPLSTSERADAEAMIRRSDNDATTRFWKALGGPRVMEYIHNATETRDTILAPDSEDNPVGDDLA
ncbi:MAG: hypothetical protein V4671_31285, partial [Armatimonadota bacterium]